MQNKSKEKLFYEQWSKSKAYRRYGHFTPYGHNSIIRIFKKLIGNRLSGNYRAIDLGCGAGAFTRRFFDHQQAECFGLDMSYSLINAARQYDEKVKYFVGDMEKICLKDETFDVVIFSGVLHHFSDIELCLREGYRILKKGGCVLSYDPNMNNPFMWLYRHPSSPFFSKIDKTDNERLLSTQEVCSAMKQVGFISINTYCISGVTFKYVASRVGRFLLPFYNVIEFLLGISPLAQKYGSFVIYYAQKK